MQDDDDQQFMMDELEFYSERLVDLLECETELKKDSTTNMPRLAILASVINMKLNVLFTEGYKANNRCKETLNKIKQEQGSTKLNVVKFGGDDNGSSNKTH